jgi:hypothetical protein
MVRKSQELRPVMTRIPEGLRSKLAREGKKNGRSMNAEIVYRLEQSFEQGDIIEAVREEISSGFTAGFAAGLRDAPQPATFKDDARRAGFKVDAQMVAAFKRALKELGIDPNKPEGEDK